MSSESNENSTGTTTTSSPKTSKSSSASKKRSPLVLVNPLVITPNFENQFVRISLSDTEVEVRKQNVANYGEAAYFLSGGNFREYSPLPSSRFQVVDKAKSIAVQKLVLQDFELKSQSTDQDSDEMVEEEIEEDEEQAEDVDEDIQPVSSDINSIETQYSSQPASSGCKKSSDGTNRTEKQGSHSSSSARSESQYLSSECMIFNILEYAGADESNTNINPDFSCRSDYYIVLNIGPTTTATIEEIHSSAEDSGKSKHSSARSCSPRCQYQSPEPLPASRRSVFSSFRQKPISNRIFPIEEESENSSTTSPLSDIPRRRYQELENRIQKILESAAAQNQHRPPSRRPAWSEQCPADTQSMPELPKSQFEENSCLPNAIAETTFTMETNRSNNTTTSISSSVSSRLHRNFKEIPEIEVIESKDAEPVIDSIQEEGDSVSFEKVPESENDDTISRGCSCLDWLRRIICGRKIRHGKRPIKVYKAYFCDMCPECKCTTARF